MMKKLIPQLKKIEPSVKVADPKPEPPKFKRSK